MRSTVFLPLEKHVFLASPTMHGKELEYMTEAFRTNWMSTVGENICAVERIAAYFYEKLPEFGEIKQCAETF